MPLTDVTLQNIDSTGFFCYMSKKKSEGYARKLAWLKARLAEGMRIKMLNLPERGFIEYIPGSSAWRAIRADGYMVIHCIWVVGKSKGRGLGRRLLEECLADARSRNMNGVAMVTSEKTWLADKALLVRNGFECVDTAPPAFSLMVRKFGKHPSPSFAGGWEKKAAACGDGLTIFRTDQCPYIVDAVSLSAECAKKAGRRHRIVSLESRDELMERSPSAYGVFGMVLDGEMLSYHYLLEKDLLPLLK